MGYRLYYASKYDVEFDGGFFNWKTEEANQLLQELGITPDDDACTTFEISKEEFKAKVEAIRQEYTSKSRETHPTLQPLSYGYVLSVLDEIITGTKGEYVHLEWY